MCGSWQATLPEQPREIALKLRKVLASNSKSHSQMRASAGISVFVARRNQVFPPSSAPRGLGANLASNSDAPSILAGEEHQCLSDGLAPSGWGSDFVHGHNGSIAISTALGSPRGRGESPRQQSQSDWLLYREPFFGTPRRWKRSGISQSPYPLERSTFRGRCLMR